MSACSKAYIRTWPLHCTLTGSTATRAAEGTSPGSSGHQAADPVGQEDGGHPGHDAHQPQNGKVFQITESEPDERGEQIGKRGAVQVEGAGRQDWHAALGHHVRREDAGGLVHVGGESLAGRQADQEANGQDHAHHDRGHGAPLKREVVVNEGASPDRTVPFTLRPSTEISSAPYDAAAHPPSSIGSQLFLPRPSHWRRARWDEATARAWVASPLRANRPGPSAGVASLSSATPG